MADEKREIKNDPEQVDYITPMLSLLGTAVSTIQTQDLQEITIILQKGKSLFKKAAQEYGENAFELGIMQMCLYNLQASYLTVKAAYSKLEEKFDQTLLDFQQAIAVCADGKHLIKTLGEHKGEVWESVFLIYDFLFSFFGCYCEGEAIEMEHEIKIEKGGFSDPAEILRASAQKYRQINEVEINYDDKNPTIPALIKMLNRLADIKDDKAERVAKSAGVLKHLPMKSKKVFLVHGHAEALLLELRDLLEKRFKLDCIILKTEGNLGDSVIEKFERFAGECGYAIAILSPDDLIEQEGKQYFQARPNVLFEMGWFYGRYGRSNLCILKQEGTAMPSDLGGIICLEFDKKVAEVFLDLETELKSVGIID